MSAPQDDPEVRAALDSQLVGRILSKVAILLSSAGVAGLCFKAKHDLDDDLDLVRSSRPGTEFSKELTDKLSMGVALGGALAVHAPPMILFIAMKWHHPSRKNSPGLIQKSRPILMTLMSGQFFLVSLALVAFATIYIGTKELVFEPGVRDPERLADQLGIKYAYRSRSIFVVLLVLCWFTALFHLISFLLELASFRKFKRALRFSSAGKV